MKVTLNFNTSEPGQYESYMECVQAPNMQAAIAEFERWLAYKADCGDPVDPDIVRDRLFEALNENGAKLRGWG